MLAFCRVIVFTVYLQSTIFLKQWYSIAFDEYAEIQLPGIGLISAKQAEFKRAWKHGLEKQYIIL